MEEKLEEAKLEVLPVNEAKEFEMFRNVDISKMSAREVLEEFDRYAQSYNGKAEFQEINKNDEYKILNIKDKWKKHGNFEIALYRDKKTNKLFTRRTKYIGYNYIDYNYIHDGIYKTTITRVINDGKVGGIDEISYATDGKVYLKRATFIENVEPNWLTDITYNEKAMEENSKEIQDVMKHERVDIIAVYIGFPAGGSMLNIREKVFYVWDNKTGKYIAKLRRVED